MNKKWITLFFITIFLIAFLISANVNYFDFDLWARLIAGMGVVDGHTVLKEDFLSYTPTHTWWDHEYGSGVIFYLFLKYFGGYSLILLQTVIIFLIVFVTIQIVKLRGNKSPYNFLFYIFPIIALATNFGHPIRCHLFSFLFFAIYLYILEYHRKSNSKTIYLLPVLTIIWNNLHGGVIAGLGLIVMYATAELFDKKDIKAYLISGLLSVAVLIINPWGYEYIKFLVMANTMPRPDVMEWWGLFSKFHLYKQIPFKIFMLLTIALETIKIFNNRKKSTLAETLKNIDKSKAIVLIVTLCLAIKHIKLLPFFVICGTAYCYEDFNELLETKLPKWTEKFTLILIAAICIFGLTVKNYDLPLGKVEYPHREIEFLKINNLKGNLLINFGLGSFASYKLYPNNKIYMDGRYEEVYNEDMVPLLKQFYLVKENWDEVLKKYPPDIIIIEKYYPIYEKLNSDPNWSNVYDTKNFAVYVKTNEKKEKYKQPDNSLEYYKNTLFDTSVKF